MMKWLGAAIVLAFLAPPGADPSHAQPYDGPPSSGTRYWEVPAFRDYPPIGPDKAVGIIFWSHGLAGTTAQYQFPPPSIILEFAKRNWDAVKVQRNPVYEVSWGRSGQMHVDDLLERVKTARASGYERVIVAGQSYGGGISLEAAGRTDQIFGVLAFAPGHGSTACSGDFIVRVADVLPGLLERVRAPRIVVSITREDDCVGVDRPGPEIEQAVRRMQGKYIYFDATTPIRGRNAASLNQFTVWYGDCVIGFMAPDREPAPGRTECPPPPNPRFLVPAGLKLDARTGRLDAPANLAGPWLAKFAAIDGQEVCIVLDQVSADEASGMAYFGPGERGKLSMTARRVVARKTGDSYVHQSSENYQIILTPRPAPAELALTIVASDAINRWTSPMQRGCAG